MAKKSKKPPVKPVEPAKKRVRVLKDKSKYPFAPKAAKADKLALPQKALNYIPYAAPAEFAAKAGAVASGIFGDIMNAMATDVFIMRGRHLRGTKKKPLPPVDWEAHVNPLGITMLALGAGATLWLLQIRLHPQIVEVITGRWICGENNVSPILSGLASETDWRGKPPTCTIHIPEKGYWDYANADVSNVPSGWSSNPDYKGPGGWIPGAVWVVTDPAHDEQVDAVWHEISRYKERKWTLEPNQKDKNGNWTSTPAGWIKGLVLPFGWTGIWGK